MGVQGTPPTTQKRFLEERTDETWRSIWAPTTCELVAPLALNEEDVTSSSPPSEVLREPCPRSCQSKDLHHLRAGSFFSYPLGRKTPRGFLWRAASAERAQSERRPTIVCRISGCPVAQPGPIQNGPWEVGDIHTVKSNHLKEHLGGPARFLKGYSQSRCRSLNSPKLQIL